MSLIFMMPNMLNNANLSVCTLGAAASPAADDDDGDDDRRGQSDVLRCLTHREQ